VTPDVLRRLPILQGRSDAQLDAVSAVLVRRRVSGGVAIVGEGERSSSLYVLTAGSVGTTKRLGLAAQAPADAARQKVLVPLAVPQFSGETGLLSDLERSATITTGGDRELLELRRQDFDRLVPRDAALGYRLVRNIAVVLAERLRRTDLDVLKLTTAPSLALGNR